MTMNGIYLLNTDAYAKIYGDAQRAAIAARVNMIAPQQTTASIEAHPTTLADVDVIFSGWGMAKLDEAFLAAAPKLKVVFYGAGSIRGFATDAAWDRGIIITSAYAANAVPVAEYTLSQIFFSLKHGWHYAFTIKRERQYPTKTPVPGGYESTIGIISLGMIGRRVAELLRPFDLHVIAYDPYVSVEEGKALGVEMCSLDEIFRRSDVVSLHTPWYKETEGMITGKHLNAMKRGATFINTARGAVVREQEMIKVLQQRPDIFAILDVTYPEPPQPGSPLYTLPNVVLTPHIAGSMFRECNRMGQYMVEELERYLAGEPLRWSISRERAKIMA